MSIKRIIPCIEIKEGKTVKNINYFNVDGAADPVEQSIYYEEQGADELLFVDISYDLDNRKKYIKLIKKISSSIKIPFTVGGRIISIEDAELLLNAGADKIVINTAVVKEPGLISEMAMQFGSHKIIVAIDSKLIDDDWYVHINSGMINTGLKTRHWAIKSDSLGAGEILLNSLDHNGTKNGFAIEHTRNISEKLTIPLIASGGAGNMQHFADILSEGNADAALASTIFHFNEIKINELKKYLKKNKINLKI